MTFSETLSAIVKSRKLTIYATANKCGIERSLLSKVLNGSRTLSIDNFEAIIRSLSLTANESRMLREAYIDEYYDRGRFNNYINMFKSVSTLEELNVTSVGKIKIAFELDGNMLRFNSKSDFINITKSVFSNELYNENGGRIYSNVKPEFMIEVFKSVPKGKNTRKLDYKQILPVNTEKGMYAQSIYYTMLFMLMGYRTNYYTVKSDTDEHIDLLFPCYVISGDTCIFVDADMKNGYVLKDKKIADIYAEKFLKSVKNTRSFLSESGNIIDIKEQHMALFSQKIDKFYSVESSFCVMMFMTHGMWEQIAKPQIPNREFLRDSTYAYYQKFLESIGKYNSVVSRKGLEYFSETGIVSQMPAELADPMTVENRIEVLKRFLEYYRTNPDAVFRIIKPDEFDMKYQLDTEIFDMRSEHSVMNLSIATNVPESMSDFIGNFAINISDVDTVADFLEFTEMFIASGICYSREESLSLVEEEIKKLEYKLK